MEMSERQQQFSGTGDIRTGQEVDVARLTDWMAGHVEGFAGPLTVEQFKGIVEKQMPESEKLKRADYIIVNDDTKLVIPQVLALHEQFIG